MFASVRTQSSQTKPFSFFHAPRTQSIQFIYNYEEDTVKSLEERVSERFQEF